MLNLFSILKQYRFSIFIVMVLIFFQALSELFLPTLMSDIVDIGIIEGDTSYILRVGGLMLLVAAAGSSALIVSIFLSSRVAVGFGRILRSQVFSRIESFSLHEFDKIGTASLITRTTNDINQIQQITLMGLRMVIRAPMLIIGGIIMAVSKDARLSWLIVFVIPIIAAAIFLVTRRGLPLFKKLQVKLDKLNRILRESLMGIRVIRAFNKIDYEKKRFNQANLDLTSTAIKVNRVMAALTPILMLVLNFTIIAIIWLGSIRVDNGTLQVGDLMAFIQYVMQIMSSLIMLSSIFVMIPRASASAARINEILGTLPNIQDTEQPLNHNGSRGSVEFKNVSFSYPGADQPAVNNISFYTGPGEVTAIIGGTGSGKSALLNLIPRFYDVSSGSVLVDGIDVREIEQDTLRAKIGLVPQDTFLFTGTVADNIRYGKKDASDEEVRQAAETAQADDFIDAMENGFDSLIAQGGSNVSGGQKQRISIARALVRKPRIYIFDDSFSALDLKIEARLRAALRDETAGSTVIIVTQRVSTVINADQIIVLERGQIAGIGSHQELLDTCEVYREIVSSQLSEEESA